MADSQPVHKILASGNAERMDTAAGRFFMGATFYGYKAFGGNGQGTSNTDSIFIGIESGKLPVEVPPGGSATWVCPPGARQELYEMWARGTSTDGVYCVLY